MTNFVNEFRELQGRIGAMNASKGFHGASEVPEQYRHMYFIMKLALIANEAVGEGLDEIRKGRGVTEEYFSYPPTPASLAAEFSSGAEATEYFQAHTAGKPEGFPSELADVVIRALDLAEEAGIDLWDVIQRKLDFNDTREFRHGKSF